MKNYHCCATCIHFQVEKDNSGIKRFCSRLGFKTDPKWQFNCWTPKEHVKNLMIKQNNKHR